MTTSLFNTDRRTVLKRLSALLPIGSIPTFPALAGDIADEVSSDSLDVERVTASRAFAATSQSSKYALLTDCGDHSLDELPDSSSLYSYQSQHTWSHPGTEIDSLLASSMEFGICDVVLHTFDVTSTVDARRAWYDTFYEVIDDHATQQGRPMRVEEHRDAFHPAFYARIPGREQYDVVFHAGPNWILTIEANDTRSVPPNFESLAGDHYEWVTSTEFPDENCDLPADDRWETVDPSKGYSVA